MAKEVRLEEFERNRARAEALLVALIGYAGSDMPHASGFSTRLCTAVAEAFAHDKKLSGAMQKILKSRASTRGGPGRTKGKWWDKTWLRQILNEYDALISRSDTAGEAKRELVESVGTRRKIGGVKQLEKILKRAEDTLGAKRKQPGAPRKEQE